MSAWFSGSDQIVLAKQQPDIFASGLHSIEHAGGGCFRFVLYVNKIIDGKTVRVLVDPGVVMPIDAIPDAIGKTLMALGRQVVVSASGVLTVAH